MYQKPVNNLEKTHTLTIKTYEMIMYLLFSWQTFLKIMIHTIGNVADQKQNSFSAGTVIGKMSILFEAANITNPRSEYLCAQKCFCIMCNSVKTSGTSCSSLIREALLQVSTPHLGTSWKKVF